MDDRVAIGTHRVKTSVSKYGSQQSNQQRTSLFVLAMDREWFGLKGVCFQGRRTGGGEAGLAMEMATSVDKSSFFRRLQRNVTVQWENTVAPCSPIFHFHRSIVPLFHHSSQSLRITILLHPPVSTLVYACVYVYVCEKIVHLFFFQYSSNPTRLRELTQEMLRSKRWNEEIK